jgi:hypothetical protein
VDEPYEYKNIQLESRKLHRKLMNSLTYKGKLEQRWVKHLAVRNYIFLFLVLRAIASVKGRKPVKRGGVGLTNGAH